MDPFGKHIYRAATNTKALCPVILIISAHLLALWYNANIPRWLEITFRSLCHKLVTQLCGTSTEVLCSQFHQVVFGVKHGESVSVVAHQLGLVVCLFSVYSGVNWLSHEFAVKSDMSGMSVLQMC